MAGLMAARIPLRKRVLPPLPTLPTDMGTLQEAVSEVAAALRDLCKSNADLPNHPPDYLAHELWLWCDFDDPPPVEVVKKALKEVGR
jgi:hypothetical protein